MWELEEVFLYQGMHWGCSCPHCMLSPNQNHPGCHGCHSQPVLGRQLLSSCNVTMHLVRLLRVWVQRLCLEMVQKLKACKQKMERVCLEGRKVLTGAELAAGTPVLGTAGLFAQGSWWRSGQGCPAFGEDLACCWRAAELMDCSPCSRTKEQGHRCFHPGGVWEGGGTSCLSHSTEGWEFPDVTKSFSSSSSFPSYIPLSWSVLPMHFQELPLFSKSCRARREVLFVKAWEAGGCFFLFHFLNSLTVAEAPLPQRRFF